MSAGRGPPIFILGMTQRSGTNFLSRLLALHPDCTRRSPIWEDHLLYESRHLRAYVEAVSENWHPRWEVPEEESRLLLRSLGEGLVAFVAAGAESRVVTKTPSVVELEHFFDFFADAYLLVLVRDGRSVTESLVRSFGFGYRVAIRMWAEAARTVRAFDMAHRGDPRYRLVRYEDLLADLQSELSAVLAFCGLAPSDYDFAAAETLPLEGSSTDRGGQAALHWHPVPKPATFGGAARWAEWRRAQHRRFNAAAGDLLPAFGYEPEPVSVGPLSRVRRRIDDLLYAVEGLWFFRPPTPQRRRIKAWRATQCAPKQR